MASKLSLLTSGEPRFGNINLVKHIIKLRKDSEGVSAVHKFGL